MALELTPYFDEFVRYYGLANWQHHHTNLGNTPHSESPFDDDLMKQVYLYDVVERKYAGFTQILLDLWYGDWPDHPYHHKLHEIRKPIAKSGRPSTWHMPEWLYVFILHRVTGSAINYAKSPSGYWNTLLPALPHAKTIEEMVEIVKVYGQSFYTSVGYQFPAFPKPPEGYKRGGDYFLCEFAPKLARELAEFLGTGISKKTLRQVGEWMFKWNKDHGLRAYKFQYAAVVADIADFYPDTVDRSSLFFYGKNAIEAISYMAKKPPRLKEIDFLDAVMGEFHDRTGSLPYDAEDVACDFIRWVENYIRPGHSYAHLDRDKIFSSHKITDHPFGRQPKHLELGLIKSFNDLNVHPSDDYVLRHANVTVEQYKQMVKA